MEGQSMVSLRLLPCQGSILLASGRRPKVFTSIPATSTQSKIITATATTNLIVTSCNFLFHFTHTILIIEINVLLSNTMILI